MSSLSVIHENPLQNENSKVSGALQSGDGLIKGNTQLEMNRKISLASTQTAESTSDNKQNPVNAQVCKICLSEIDTLKIKRQQLISPCTCTGSMKYVHQQCLRGWLNAIVTKNLQKNQNTYKICCEICKFPYQYEIYHKLQCSSKDQVKEKVRQKLIFTIIICMFLIFSLGGIIALCYLTFAGKITNQKTQTPNYSILIAFGCVLLVVMLLAILLFVWVCIVKRIGFVKTIKAKPQQNNHKIIYSRHQQFGI